MADPAPADFACAAPTALNLVGFDSAWADNPKVPGAICALRLTGDGPPRFDPPRPADFAQALDFIRARHAAGELTIVAIDQPTIVHNEGGARPVERAVASLMSFSGGGIQPAYRGKTALFGDGAPIWRFLDGLGFADDPEAAAVATVGGFVMEVFPALALLALDPAFTSGPKRGPRYNPSRATFQLAAWQAVCQAAAVEARRLGFIEAADWCVAIPRDAKPGKRRQDALDAVICLLVAARWRAERSTCLKLGDLQRGYIVAPASADTRVRLARSAVALQVPLS